MPASDPLPPGACPVGGACPHRPLKTILFVLMHGVLLLVSFPPLGLWPLAPLSVAPLAWAALHARSTRFIVFVTLGLMTGLWLWFQSWVAPITTLGYPLFALYMAFYQVVFVWLVRRVGAHDRFVRVPMTFVVSTIWIGLECVRGEIVFGGYAWYLVGQPLIEWPVLAQSADLGSVYFVSWLAVLWSALAVDVVLVHAKLRPLRALVLPATVVVALHVANLGYGLFRVGEEAPLRAGPTMLAVQTNLPQSNKLAWSRADQIRDVRSFMEATLDGLDAAREAGRTVDLVVWPETMVPGFGLDDDTIATLVGVGERHYSLIAEGVRGLVLPDFAGVPVLVGAPGGRGLHLETREDGDYWVTEEQYNSVYLVQQDGAEATTVTRYDKVMLTPFGEMIPHTTEWLEQKLMAIGASGMSFNLDAAEEPRTLLFKTAAGTWRLGTPICFEDTVLRHCRRLVATHDAEILVNLSNDGWFGTSTAGRVGHAQAARFRCIENRVPMLRVANTGVSVAVDSRGFLIERLGTGRYGEERTAGTVLAELTLDSRRTLYRRVGESWAWACLLGTFGLFVLSRRRRTES